MRVELTDGAWADIAEVGELRDKHRKAVNKAVVLELDAQNKPVIPGDMDDNMRDALLRLIVTGWSFEHLPLPSADSESLDKLTIQDARLLHKAIKPHMLLITGQEKPTEPGTDPTES